MANTIANFLVGIGLDTADLDKGAKNVESSIDGIRSSALQLAALGAGAFGAKSLTFGFAEATDRVGKFSRVFSVLPEEVTAFGRALEHEGGTLESFMSQMANLDRMRAMTPAQVGGLFAEAGIRGIDPSVVLNAESAIDAYLKLSDVFAGLSKTERLSAAEIFGFDEASIRLLSHGSETLRMVADHERELRPLTEAMTREAARFNDQWQDLNTNLGGVADQISMKVLPGISDTITGMNHWIDANREFIASGIDKYLDPMADHITEIAIAGGLLASGGLLAGLAGMAKHVPLIGGGLATAASAAAKISGIGAAATAAYVGSEIIDEQLQKSSLYNDIDAAVTKAIFNVTGFDVSRGNVYEGMTPSMWGGSDAVMATPYQRQSNPTQSPQRPIQVNLNLDGRVIDQRIIDVTESQYNDAITDIATSTGG
jgi:hypothetical protein